jgi:formate-dependent phosphoribosylglycinamide formyltransferase (GAR transformylase)
MFTSHATSDKTYLLLLKADEFLRDRCIMAALRTFRGPVIGMSVSPASPKNRYFDHVLKGDPHLPASALAAVEAFERSHGMTPAAVIPVTEMSLYTGLSIAERYGLPYLSRACVDRARNKDQMKAAFQAAKLSSPRFELFRDLEGLGRAIETLGLPVIVKPCAAAHSIGVIKISSQAEVRAAYDYCVSGLRGVQDAWKIENAVFQAEQFVEADREVSVEIINHGHEHRVLAVTEKYLTPPPYFAEIGHMVPSLDKDNAKLKTLAIGACEALGVDRGVSHVEVRIDRQGEPFLIEVAARPGGDGIMDQVERAYGVNLYDLHIRSYLGTLEQLPPAPTLRGVSAIAFMQIGKGTIKAVAPIGELPDEVVSLYVTARAGDKVGESLNYDDRVGTVEYFWPEERGNLGRRHLELTDQLARKIFTLE